MSDGLPTIDYIYELLEAVEADEADVRRDKRRRNVDVGQVPGISDAVSFLEEQGYGRRLGLSDMDLDKFLRIKGRLDSTVVLKTAGRAKSLLREVEGELKGITLPVPTPAETLPAPEESVEFAASKWVVLHVDQNAVLIASISTLLDEAVTLARGTNLPPDRAALTDIQRKQLIAILETTLAVLKAAPLVEKSLIKMARDAAAAGAVSGLQKGSELGMAFALKKLAELLGKLVGLI